jgi:hypothetical protein
MADADTATVDAPKGADDKAKPREPDALDKKLEDLNIPPDPEPTEPEGDPKKKPDADPDSAATAPDDAAKKDDGAAPKPDDAVPDPDASDGPKLTEQQQAAVKRMGLSDELVEAWGDRAGEFIDELGDTHSRQMGKIGNRMRQQLEQARKDAAAESDSGDTPPEGHAKPEQTTTGEIEQITEEDLYEPGQAVAKLNAAFSKVNALLREALTSRDDRETDQERADHEEAERFFASLVDDKGKTDFPEFGTGPTSRMLDGSPEKIARGGHEDDGHKIRLAYELGGEPMTLTEAMQIALDHKGRDRLDKAAQDALRKEIAKRKKGTVVRPGGGRRAPADTADAKADREFDEFARTHGGKVIPP